MEVKVKKLDPNAVIPTKAHVSDAGFDLVAISKNKEPVKDYWEYGTGLSIEVPEGHVGYLFPRSSISKKEMSLANSVGVIDSGYRGEILFRFKTNALIPRDRFGFATRKPNFYEVGDRIGQLIIMPIPEVSFVEVDELGDSERGAGGFGSSGS